FGDSIYFHDDAGVYVNLFIASELDDRERGVRLTQETRFPLEESTRLTVHCAHPTRFAMRVRVPYWVGRAGSATLNGRRLDAFAGPSSYLVVDRTWKDGDRLEMALPMGLHADPTPDNPAVQALMYGPLVLAGRLGTAGLTPDVLRAEPTKPRTVPEYKADPVPAPSFVSAGGLDHQAIAGRRSARVPDRWAGDRRHTRAAPYGDRRAVRRVLEGRIARHVTGPLSRRDALKILGATSASALFGSPNEDLGGAPGANCH